MRILHYFLGFHRQGGLNRYAADLASAQAAAGDDVFALYPAGGWRVPKKTVIRKRGKCRDVRCFAIIGGPAVPLLEGIQTPEMLLDCPRRLSTEEMTKFWRLAAPDVVHIHTWMGFPEELFEWIRSSGAKIVYTTHDYFGLCPKVNRLRPDGTVCCDCNDENCSQCNRFAPSERQLFLRNWELLIRLRKVLLPLKRLIPSKSPSSETAARTIDIKPFGLLRERYVNWMRQCDVVHFNSPVTEKIFTAAISGLRGVMLPITHGGIRDRRKKSVGVSAPLQLLFSGSVLPYKGLPELLKVLGELEAQGFDNWQLNIYGGIGKNQKRVIYYGNYEAKDGWNILEKSDLLIVPSICDETFGFVVEEALCCGVPVLCSDRAGAKVLLPPEWVFSGAGNLKEKLKEIFSDPEILLQRKKSLRNECRFISMTEHVGAVKRMYLTK